MAATPPRIAWSEEDSPGYYLEKSLEREWKAFHKTLDNFPHSFHLEDVEKRGKASYQELLDLLLVDLNADLRTPLEIARTQNLIGYFHFLLNNSREALERIEEALAQTDQERNLVSLGNRAVILWQTGQRDKAKEQVKTLEKLKEDSDFSYLTVRGKAELAFSYTRLSGSFLPKAIALFTEVITEARPPEVWLWKFGLALSQRRMVHVNSAPVLAYDAEEQKLMSALDTLQEVINNSQCTNLNLKAKCYSEIAHLLQERRGTKSQKRLESKVKLTSIEACKKALELDSNDCSVLWKCGKIFRYAKHLDESVKLLQKSILLRPTSTAYHHLALTFKALAKKAKGPEKSEWQSDRGRGRPRNRSGRVRGGYGSERDEYKRTDSGEHVCERSGMDETGASRRLTESDCSGRGQKNWRWNANQRKRGQVHSQDFRYSRQGWVDSQDFRYSRQGRVDSRDFGYSRRGWVDSSDFGYSPVPSQNRNANQNHELNAGGWQYNPLINKSKFHSGSYSSGQPCASQRNDRMRTNSNIGIFPQQNNNTKERAAEDDASTCGASALYEAVLENLEDVKTSHSQSRGEQMMDTDGDVASEQSGLLLGMSRLSLNTNDKLPKAKLLPNDNQQSPSRNLTAFPYGSPQGASDRDRKSVSQREIQSFRGMVKSPSTEANQYRHTDAFVQEAMDALQKAVDISKEQNLRAVYDLALMHIALREFQEALRLLDIIQRAKYGDTGLFDKINAYEQAGLALKEMSLMESDAAKKQKLNEEGESKLNTALRLCSRLCSKLPRLQYYIQHVWHAFPTLLRDVDKSNRHITDKLSEKARLFSLIKDSRQSMALLQQISNISPEKANCPDHLRMCIENYVELELFDQALAFIEMLRLTAQRSAMEQFDDPQYVQKVYLKAGKAALLSSGSSKDAASSYFSDVFAETYSNSPVEASSSEDTESIDEAYENDSWDIMLLHEQSADSKAVALANIFEKVFGLTVTDMLEDCLPGTIYEDSLSCIMKRSKLIVVLAGRYRLKPHLRMWMWKAARRSTTVALLTDGEHVPRAIMSMNDDWRQKHHMICPEELLNEENFAEGRELPQSLVEKVCDVFSFIVNVPFI